MASSSVVKIEIENMPVIQFSQRVQPPLLPQKNNASDLVLKVVPRPEDEPEVVSVLSGKYGSGYVEICGWTSLTPLRFFNIRDFIQLHEMIDGHGEVVPAAVELFEKCISLREMSHLIGGPNHLVHCPVLVHVVAKRKVDVVPFSGKVLLIPLLIVADNSGYCVLCSMNEGLATLYNAVEIGDILLISHCLPQRPRRTYHRGLFSNDMFLDMELKVQYHSVRRHFIRHFSAVNSTQFRIPDCLFQDSSSSSSILGLKLPSHLEKEFNAPAPHANDMMKVHGGDVEQYYDIAGVVAYVGRMERFQSSENATLDVVKNGLLQPNRSLARFLLCRWICLVDPQSSGTGFPVKVYVNNITWNQQDDIVPGAIIAITNCITITNGFSEKFCTTSNFSQVYARGNLEKYLMLNPDTYKTTMSQIMTKSNYVDIITRSDVHFLVGGNHQWKIGNEENFKEYYFENKTKLYKDIKQVPMRRRESRRLFFEGVIVKVKEVRSDGKAFFHKPMPTFMNARSRVAEYHRIQNFADSMDDLYLSWYAWQRQLPKVDTSLLRHEKWRDICNGVVEGYKPYIGWLSVPAMHQNVEQLMEMKKMDGPPYIRLDIVNAKDKIWYEAIWKCAQSDWNDKLRKVMNANGKGIVGILEIYCTEIDAPLEVNLIDFVLA